MNFIISKIFVVLISTSATFMYISVRELSVVKTGFSEMQNRKYVAYFESERE